MTIVTLVLTLVDTIENCSINLKAILINLKAILF